MNSSAKGLVEAVQQYVREVQERTNPADIIHNIQEKAYNLPHYLVDYMQQHKDLLVGGAIALSLLALEWYVLEKTANLDKKSAERITPYLGLLALGLWGYLAYTAVW